MASEQDFPLSVTLHGIEDHQLRTTTQIESWSIDTSYLVPTDGFDFELFESDDNTSAFAAGFLAGLDQRPVTLSIDGQPQLIGRIEITEIGRRGSAVTCRGRDYIADLVECNVDPTFKLRDDMTLEQALLGVCEPCGITRIVDDADDYDGGKTIRQIRSGTPKLAKGTKRKPQRTESLKDLQPKPGEGIYEYCDRICARMGLTIQPGPDRQTLFLTAPFYDEPSLYRPIQRLRSGLSSGNNVLSAYAVRDYTRIPSFVLGTGTAATAGKRGEPIASEIDAYGLSGSLEISETVRKTMFSGRRKPGADAGKAGEESDADDLRLYRLLYFRDDDARTEEQLDRAIRRAYAERAKDTLSYRVTVRGHKDPETDAIWTVDRMVDVHDEICAVNEPLWIAKRTLRFDPTNGATTDLECWRPHSFPFFDETEALAPKEQQ
jgi:prophage tail gpP-like protein